MIVLSWQEVVTIISFVLSIIGTGTSIWGLINTGLIKKAVNKTHDDLMNKLKFITHRDTYLSSIKNIKEKLSTSRGFRLSSDKMKEISIEIEETIKWLKDCNKHFSKEDKQKTEDIANRLNELNSDQNIIFDDSIVYELRSFSQDIFLLLSKEDYYL